MTNSRYSPEEALCDDWGRRSFQIDGLETLIQFVNDTWGDLIVLAYGFGILPATSIASLITLRSSVGQQHSRGG